MDSEPIKISRKCPDDFTTMLTDILSSVKYKFLGILLIVFLLLSSDIFINRVLSKFQGAVDYKCPTSWGTFLQGLFLVISCIIIDAAIGQKII